MPFVYIDDMTTAAMAYAVDPGGKKSRFYKRRNYFHGLLNVVVVVDDFVEGLFLSLILKAFHGAHFILMEVTLMDFKCVCVRS